MKQFATAILVLGSAFVTAAFGQAGLPSKPIRIIVPFAAGGATDVLARVIAAPLGEKAGHPVIVENRLGANGTIGSEAVAKAAPDGTTLLMGTIATHSIQPALGMKLPYSPDKDFVPVVQAASQAYAVVANPGFAPNTMRELAALAKREPAKVSYASAGKGTAAHLFAELFASLADVQFVPVHYKGAAPAMNDVMGGHVPFTFDVVLTTLSQIKSGKLKALAVTSERRSPALPDVPTIAESGYPGYNAVGWNGLFAPAGTPRETVARLASEVSAILHRPEVREKIIAQGAEVVGGTPEQFSAFIRADSAKWAQLIKKQHITPD
jgi:tripartite-type tricarboxylate transporter receptor subunit TctC